MATTSRFSWFTEALKAASTELFLAEKVFRRNGLREPCAFVVKGRRISRTAAWNQILCVVTVSTKSESRLSLKGPKQRERVHTER